MNTMYELSDRELELVEGGLAAPLVPAPVPVSGIIAILIGLIAGHATSK